MQRIVVIYAAICLAGAIALLASSARIGRRRAASWMVMLGIFMLWVEEPGLTLWLGISPPALDRDGMATLVTPQACAHVMDTAVLGTLLMAFLGWVALAPFRRGERWAGRGLAIAWGVLAATLTTTTALIHARGLSFLGSAHTAGFGWQPLAVGLLAWGLGLATGSRPDQGRVAPA